MASIHTQYQLRVHRGEMNFKVFDSVQKDFMYFSAERPDLQLQIHDVLLKKSTNTFLKAYWMDSLSVKRSSMKLLIIEISLLVSLVQL